MEKAASLNQHVIGYGELAEREWAALGLDAPDMAAARRYRLTRIRAELAKRDLAGIVVYDPLNVRYATDSTDMQLWCTHNAVRYAFVATEGPVILWDFHNCEHLSWHLDAGRRDPPRQGVVLLRGGRARGGAGEALGGGDRRPRARLMAAATGGSRSTRSTRTASSRWPSSAYRSSPARR